MTVIVIPIIGKSKLYANYANDVFIYENIIYVKYSYIGKMLLICEEYLNCISMIVF